MKKKNFLIIILTVLVFLSAAVLGVATVYRVSEVTVDVATVSKAAQAEAQANKVKKINYGALPGTKPRKRK